MTYQEALQERDRLIAEQTAVQTQIVGFEFDIEGRCRQRLRPFGLTAYCGQGEVRVTDYTKKGKQFSKINGLWCWYEGSARQYYAHRILWNLAPPFDTAELESVCRELSAELGIPVVLSEYSTVSSVTKLGCSDDFIVAYPASTTLAEGEIWSMGWDIADRWAVMKAPDGNHVLYSTNGHGMGFDVHLKPGEDLTGFLVLTQQEGFKGAREAQVAICAE